MKRGRGSSVNNPRVSFYKQLFDHPEAANVLFNQLATLCGTFRPEQRLIVPRIEKWGGGETFLPDYLFRSVADVRHCIMDFSYPPLCLEFSGICPALHVEGLPWYRTPKQYLPANREDKPRKSDRAYHREGVASWLGELILDVDLSDDVYDRRGVCACAGQKTPQCCDACWRVFLRPAMKVIEFLMRDAGIEAYFFVYSGRRGFHCWVVDPHVILWTREQRKTFIQTLVHHLPESDTPLTDAILAILEPTFRETPSLLSRYVAPLIPRQERRAWRDAVFKALYPKFDVPVSEDATHNHKLPLMLHPSTHRFCTTIDDVEGFIPSQNRHMGKDVTMELLTHALKPIQRALDIAFKHEDKKA